MSSKTNAACRTVATRSNKSSSDISKQPVSTDNTKLPLEGTLSGIAVFDVGSTLIEVTVKTKGRKRTSTMVSSSASGPKAVEQKRKPSSSSSGLHQNWIRVLQEQNRSVLKQSLQQIPSGNPSAKSSKRSMDTKDKKKGTNIETHEKHEHVRSSKHLDEVPVKLSPSEKKSEGQSKANSHTTGPSSASLAATMEPLYVSDTAVQCSRIFEAPNDRFGVFNPIRTMGFLTKELKELVKDDRSKKILIDMEGALYRIHLDSGKSTPMDLEAISLRAKLEASTLQLEETSKKMNTMCESFRDERDCLQRQVHKQKAMLEDAHVRQTELDTMVKKLRHELDEAIQRTELKDKTIYQLKEESKGVELSQTLIRSLKSDLSKQSELARQRHMEMQYLILEKDKLSVLSSYKDSLLAELRAAVKELQEQIANQLLLDSKEMYAQEENVKAQMSAAQPGVAYSSPNSSSLEHTYDSSFWCELSDLSLPPKQNPSAEQNAEKLPIEKDKGVHAKNTTGDSDKLRPKNTSDSKIRDSGKLEFVSLPCGETSYTNLFPSYKEQPCKDPSQSTSRLKDDATVKKTDNIYLSTQSSAEISRPEASQNPPEKISKKRVSAKGLSKTKKSLGADTKQTARKSTVLEDVSTIAKDILANDPVGSDIKEQFQNIFAQMRLQSRIPIDIPSPPRYYLHPNSYDCSWPTISAASDI